MRYVEARLDESNREEAYRIYVTKSLNLAPQEQMAISYIDLLELINKAPEKEPTGDEIVSSIMQKAGLRFGE